MQASNVNRYGRSIMTYFNGNTSVDSVYVGNFSVKPGPMVKGDFSRPNAWSYDIDRTDLWKGSTFEQNRGGLLEPWKYWGSRTGYVCFSENDAPRKAVWDRDKTYNSALERLNESVRGDLDLGVAAAELSKTLKMVNLKRRILDNLDRASRRTAYAQRIIRRASRGDKAAQRIKSHYESTYTQTKDAMKQLANGYLEFTYGWSPLFGDIYRTISELASHALHGRMRFRGTMSSSLNDQGVVSRTIDAYPGNQVNSVISGVQRCKIAVALDIPASCFSLERFTSLNPVSLGWELIPYSFVVDWFVDVGSYLRNLETAIIYNRRFHSGYVSELFAGRTDESSTGNAWAQNGTYNRALITASSWREYKSFRRTILTSYPFPRIPPFQADLGWRRLLSAASLLAQHLPSNLARK